MNQWPAALEHYVAAIADRAGRLVASVATSNGARRRVDWLLDVFFISIVERLEERGVPRRVAADMLGMGHRTLQRRYAAATQAAAQRGHSVWFAIVEVLKEAPLPREGIAARTPRVPPVILASILNDMAESGWLEERDGKLHLTIDTNDSMSEHDLRRYTEIRRRANPRCTIEEVAAELGVDVERLSAFWEMSEDVLYKVGDENRWMVMERCARAAFELLIGAADGVESPRHRATIWYVRLDDKPDELRKKLRGTLQRINESVRELVEPHAVLENSDKEGRFWTFSAFQTIDLPEDEDEVTACGTSS